MDVEYDGDGKYTISWAAASDRESGIAAYELQEQVGLTGSWTTLSRTLTVRRFSVTGRLHQTQYFYQGRAQNGEGLWGPWSLPSDGILVDTTKPTGVTVSDEGATTASTTTLHASWTTSSDPESGIASYQYLIRQESTSGPILVPWTSVGLATEVTRTDLTLLDGTPYFIGVRARNGALLYSSPRYSDGITVQTDTTPPTGTISINDEAAYTTTSSVTLILSATDDSGTVSQMQFSNDEVTYSSPEAYATTKSWTLSAGDGPKSVSVKFADPVGNWSVAVSDTITLDTTTPEIAITVPPDGAVVGVP
jgi:hypothetical protein